jgi:serine/threonine protein phosphatase PrpC
MKCRLLACETRIGRIYERNYDRHVADEQLPLLAVVDSENDDGTAGDMVLRTFAAARDDLRRAGARGGDALQEALVKAILDANEAIFQLHATNPRYGGGASVTAVCFAAGVAAVAHVGECRLYVNEADGWVRTTTDQTLLQLFRAAGHSPPGLPAPLSERWYGGIIYAGVGLSAKPEVQAFQLPVEEPRTVLLCTAGAWQPLDPGHDGKPLPASLDGAAVARFVWDQYTRAGERDNGTVLVAEVGPV